MPPKQKAKHVKLSDEDVDELLSNGGLKPQTLKRKKAVLDDFKQFISDDGQDFETILKDPAMVERCMIKYLAGIRVQVKGKTVVPKLNYLQTILSHLRGELTKLTGKLF